MFHQNPLAAAQIIGTLLAAVPFFCGNRILSATNGRGWVAWAAGWAGWLACVSVSVAMLIGIWSL